MHFRIRHMVNDWDKIVKSIPSWEPCRATKNAHPHNMLPRGAYCVPCIQNMLPWSILCTLHTQYATRLSAACWPCTVAWSRPHCELCGVYRCLPARRCLEHRRPVCRAGFWLRGGAFCGSTESNGPAIEVNACTCMWKYVLICHKPLCKK